MSHYQITFARSATKELQAIAEPFQSNILEKIEGLATDPRPQGCKKIRGKKSLWRIRVGNYRVIYSIYADKLVVDVIAVGHRQSVYG